MQQYRVNYPLLIGLAVGTLVASGAVFALWKFQIERKSGWLIGEAEKAREAGDVREAARYYWQYLTIHSANDDTRLKYANAQADVAEMPDATGQEFQLAWQTLEGLMRDPRLSEMPEAQKLRRRLVDMYARVGRFQDALDHLGRLLEKDPKNTELQALRASYLVQSRNYDQAIDYSYKLIGYDLESDTFDVKKALAPHEPDVYSNLAVLVRTRQESAELADRIMDQLVEVNADSAEAYLARGRYLSNSGEVADGRADVEKAYQLKPEDAAVLQAMISHLGQAKEYDKARELVAKGKKLYPKDASFYQLAAEVEIMNKDYDAALAEIDEGLKQIRTRDGNILLLVKANLQLNANDLKGVQDTIDVMRKEEFRTEFPDWYAARILLSEGKWVAASEALSRLRSRIANEPAMIFLNLQEVDFFLGMCYERMGRPEMALEQYQLVLDRNPEHEMAEAGKTRVSMQVGRDSEESSDPWQVALEEELKKPKAERNWKRLDDLLKEMAKDRKMEDVNYKIMQANLMMIREDFDGAAKILAEAHKSAPENVDVKRAAVQLARANPKLGPEKALERWNIVAKEVGDSAKLRIDKADILIAMGKDDLKAELANLMTGIDSWTMPEKIALWTAMAGRYLNIGMNDEGRQYLGLAAENQPDELPPRLALFALAHDANDDEGMKEAQDNILEIVKDTNDSAWLYAEARRKLSQMRRGLLDRKAIDEIRVLVRRALEQRQNWHELHLLNAELELASDNLELALKHYDTAASLGRPYPTALATHIRLLAMAGRFADAAKQLERLPEQLRQPMLGQLYAEILFRTNQVETALQQARAATESAPDVAQNHYWYSQLLARSAQVAGTDDKTRTEKLNQAVKSMQRAIELQPESADAWGSVIAYQMMLNNRDEAQKALRDAQLALNGDNLQMFLARAYEALGRWFDAETMYRAVYEAAPEELPRAQQLAAYYLGPVYQHRPDRLVKAAPLINQLLRAGAEGKLPANDPNLFWARRMGAKVLAASGEYQSLKKAENLLTSNAQGGNLSIEDKLELAQILAPRPEPESRKKAIQLLEQVSEIQPLNEQAELVLGELYYAVGDWRQYVLQMEKAIARFNKSAALRAAYVRKLLTRSDKTSIDKATEQINRMRSLAPDATVTFELTVRLADKIGKQQAVRAELLRMLPNLENAQELDENRRRMLALFANLLVELDDLDTAEKIYRRLTSRDSKQALGLALFLGMHRSAEQSFAMLNEIQNKDNVADVTSVALDVVRAKRDQVGEKFDADIERWLQAGLLENPDSIPLQLLLADFRDLQKQYDDAGAIYRKLLTKSELTGMRRAVVLNNLSFLIALAGSATASDVDPLKLVNEAAEILGPNSDILDTRAVVWIARKQYGDAVRDLELSVTDNPTASKYFHKAQAHLLAGEKRSAIEAWEKAEELELSRDSLNRLEYQKYDDLKRQIDQLRDGSSVSQAEPLRRAG